MHYLIMAVVGGIAGWLANLLMRANKSQGALINVVVGIIGGWLGGQLLPRMGLHFPGWGGYLLTAFIGAVLLLAIVNLIGRGRLR